MTQPPAALATTATLGLRDYQEAAIRALRREMTPAPRGPGHRRVVLVMPTGSGKTRTAAALVSCAAAKGGRVLFVASAKQGYLNDYRGENGGIDLIQSGLLSSGLP